MYAGFAAGSMRWIIESKGGQAWSFTSSICCSCSPLTCFGCSSTATTDPAGVSSPKQPQPLDMARFNLYCRDSMQWNESTHRALHLSPAAYTRRSPSFMCISYCTRRARASACARVNIFAVLPCLLRFVQISKNKTYYKSNKNPNTIIYWC